MIKKSSKSTERSANLYLCHNYFFQRWLDPLKTIKKQCRGMYNSEHNTVKPVLSGHSQKDQKQGFKTFYHLIQVRSIAECSKGSILQYFRPALSYYRALRPLFRLFLSGHLRQVSLCAKVSLFHVF